MKFTFNKDNSEEIRIDFDENRTFKELLEYYLKKTNSIITLDPKRIFFFYNTKLLNKDESILNNIIKKNVTRGSKQVIRIKDKDNIIGGE